LNCTIGSSRGSVEVSLTWPLSDQVPGRARADGDIHVALWRIGDARGIAKAEEEMPAGEAVHPRFRLQEGRDRDRWMVHQPLADAGHVGDHVDAQRLQRHRRTDAGSEEMRRRVDRA
jgi:hypothetical protein